MRHLRNILLTRGLVAIMVTSIGVALVSPLAAAARPFKAETAAEMLAHQLSGFAFSVSQVEAALAVVADAAPPNQAQRVASFSEALASTAEGVTAADVEEALDGSLALLVQELQQRSRELTGEARLPRTLLDRALVLIKKPVDRTAAASVLIDRPHLDLLQQPAALKPDNHEVFVLPVRQRTPAQPMGP